jgi:hypothetical protein
LQNGAARSICTANLIIRHQAVATPVQQQFLIELEWFRDLSGRGFELAPERAALRRRAWPPPEAVTISEAAPEITYSPGKPERLVLRGKLQTYHPLVVFDALFDSFSRVDDKQSLLEFVNKYGPLTREGTRSNEGDPVEPLLRHAAQMREVLDAYNTNQIEAMQKILGPKGSPLGHGPISETQWKLVFGADTKTPLLQFMPRNLLYAIWMQLAQRIVAGDKLKNCPFCGIMFRAGVGASVRADAKFCSEEHRLQYHSRHRPSRRRSLRPDQLNNI